MNFQDLLKCVGIDRAIAYTVFSRGFQAAGSIVSMLLITRFLSPVEQGYYYTFGSVLALQLFFELGLNGIIVQYVAHEYAHVRTLGGSDDETERRALSRLSHLLRFCTRWFLLFSLGLFAVLLVAGYFFFSKFGKGQHANWILPWLLLVCATTLTFLISPVLSFIEGLGKIKEIAKVRLVQQLILMLLLWGGLAAGGKLYSGAIATLASVAVAVVLIFFSEFRVTLGVIWRKKDRWLMSYKQEIFPYQWKIAVSWMSGYFIFQLFNPVLFATEGAMVAGQMGLTLAAVNGVLNLTISWISTKVPLFSAHIARKEYGPLDSLFNRTVRQSLFVNGSGIVVLIAVLMTLHHFRMPLGDRFLPIGLVALMGISVFLSQLVFSWATYLRCHKQEPYLLSSVVGALVVGTSTLLFGNLFGVNGVVIGYAALGLAFLPWNYHIFRTHKVKWHGP